MSEENTEERKIKKVRAQLVQLIDEAKSAADRQHRSIRPEDLVPAAKQIITADVARWAAEGSLIEAGLLIGYDPITFKGLLPGIPAEDTDLYLAVVLGTVESWLGSSGSKNVKWVVSTVGSYFHGALAQMHGQAQRWADSEGELRKEIDYIRLQEEPTAGLVMSLANLGMAVYVQGRKDEARKIFEEALAVFERVPESDTVYDTAKSMIERMRPYMIKAGVAFVKGKGKKRGRGWWPF